MTFKEKINNKFVNGYSCEVSVLEKRLIAAENIPKVSDGTEIRHYISRTYVLCTILSIIHDEDISRTQRTLEIS